MLDPDQLEIVAQQGEQRFLVAEKIDPERTHILDTAAQTYGPTLPRGSVLARGYWDDPKRTDIGVILSEIPSLVVDETDTRVWEHYARIRAETA